MAYRPNSVIKKVDFEKPRSASPNLHYKNNIFHKVIKGFLTQTGDITTQNGQKSIYGDRFNDE